MDDQSKQTQNDTQTGSAASSIPPTFGSRGNILPQRSDLGMDPYVCGLESNIPHKNSLLGHHFNVRKIQQETPDGTRHGYSIEGHQNGNCNNKLPSQTYSADTAWGAVAKGRTASGLKVSELLVQPGPLPISICQGGGRDSVWGSFYAGTQEAGEAAEDPSEKMSNNPSAQKPSNPTPPNPYSQLFASEDFLGDKKAPNNPSENQSNDPSMNSPPKHKSSNAFASLFASEEF